MSKSRKQRALTAKLHKRKGPRGPGAVVKQGKKQPAGRGPPAHPGKRPNQRQNQGCGAKATVPYSAADRILLLGEANFSFALALVTHFRREHARGSEAAALNTSRQAAPLPSQSVSTLGGPPLDGSRHPPATVAGEAAIRGSANGGTSGDPHAATRTQRVRDALAGPSESPAASDACASDDEDEGGLPALCIVATTLDSRAVTLDKYPDAAANVRRLEAAGVAVLFDVDATQLGRSAAALRAAAGGAAAFDKVVFNFPHVGLGIKDQDRNVLANQALLTAFFRSAVEVVGPGSEVHVTLKTGLPYELWAIKECARGCLAAATSFRFDPASYPGYSHRRTIGFKQGLSAAGNEELAKQECRTYVFRLPDAAARPPKRRRKGRQASDDDSDGD